MKERGKKHALQQRMKERQHVNASNAKRAAKGRGGKR
jgi:hypothetical protein